MQRRGIELLRQVHSQLLDFSEGGDTGAANPGPPALPQEGGSAAKRVVKEEEKPEEEKAPVAEGGAPVVVPEETDAASASAERPPGNTETIAAEGEPRKKEKKRSSRDRERRRRREKEKEVEEGVERRSRSRQQDRRRRKSSPGHRPAGGHRHSHSRSRGLVHRPPARLQHHPVELCHPVHQASPKCNTSSTKAIPGAESLTIHPPGIPVGLTPTCDPSRGLTVRHPPNKGRQKDERNTNFRLWREYERGYY